MRIVSHFPEGLSPRPPASPAFVPWGQVCSMPLSVDSVA